MPKLSIGRLIRRLREVDYRGESGLTYLVLRFWPVWIVLFVVGWTRLLFLSGPSFVAALGSCVFWTTLILLVLVSVLRNPKS
jgi:hypothetical protein